MASFSWYQSIAFILLLFHLSKANVIFTSRPPNPTYVNNGSTAKLVWDYSDPNNVVVGIAFSVLVTGKGFKRMLFKENGVVQDHQDLPDAYRGRISMEGKATLVITKVTPKDNTMFRCLLFDKINYLKDTVQLTVAAF
ncbi:uncharacterized protein LOC111344318 isoform X2 [Stylophora pistillata]|uniref:uncharacterized protein LOC111344318 isoform X2 n=1 Tax=Stylophora pistillata TaxID=50429 RepID=UPI000C057C87|nr:uncharacterized protein LOC111344318 isoform X2 [Stylophora pistillata]